MKAKLFAKKPTGKGHVYLDTVEVRDGSWDFKIPVRQPVGIASQPVEVTSSFTDAVRVFVRKKTFMDWVEGEPPHFYEE